MVVVVAAAVSLILAVAKSEIAIRSMRMAFLLYGCKEKNIICLH